MAKTNYEDYGAALGKMLTCKQQNYGDAFGKAGDVLQILYPDGIRPDQYDDALAVTRIIDKLFRIANGSLGDESPYKDIGGYGILGWARQESENAKGK